MEVLDAAGTAAAGRMVKYRLLAYGLAVVLGRGEAYSPMMTTVLVRWVVQALLVLVAYGHATVSAAVQLVHRSSNVAVLAHCAPFEDYIFICTRGRVRERERESDNDLAATLSPHSWPSVSAAVNRRRPALGPH